MANFADSHLGKLRAVVGSRLLLVPGARVVVQDREGRVLLQHRTDFDLWGLPGGNAEEDEDLESVIIREMLEETGLAIKHVKPFGFACNPKFETIRFPNGDMCQFFGLMFYTNSFTGDPVVVDDESRALAWFEMRRLPAMLPNMARSVAAFERFRATGAFQMI